MAITEEKIVAKMNSNSNILSYLKKWRKRTTESGKPIFGSKERRKRGKVKKNEKDENCAECSKDSKIAWRRMTL